MTSPQREAEECAFQRLLQGDAKVEVRLESVGELGQQVRPLEGDLQTRLSRADAGQVPATAQDACDARQEQALT